MFENLNYVWKSKHSLDFYEHKVTAALLAASAVDQVVLPFPIFGSVIGASGGGTQTQVEVGSVAFLPHRDK